MDYILYIGLAVIILLAMIVIHEYGHYLAGKWLGFEITEFSVGFGPKLLQKRLKNGEKFTLRAIPLGGYCAFVDENGLAEDKLLNDSTLETSQIAEQDNINMPQGIFVDRSTLDNNDIKTESDKIIKPIDSSVDSNGINVDSNSVNSDIAINTDSKTQVANQPIQQPKLKKSFVDQKPWKRLIVFVAGAAFNFISAILFTMLYIGVVGYSVPQVVDLYRDANGNPYAFGLQKGDQIVSINDRNITIMNSYQDIIAEIEKENSKNNGNNQELKVYFGVVRDGENIKIEVKRQKIEYDANGEQLVDTDGHATYYYGFGFSNGAVSYKVGFLGALQYCVPLTLKFSWMILGSIGQIFTGAVRLNDLTGPVSTIGTIATVSQANPLNILILLPLIAANLAIFNLLPIPALDGSKIVFTTIEWVRGKPVNRKIENWIHLGGLVFLLGFVVLVEILRLVT